MSLIDAAVAVDLILAAADAGSDAVMAGYNSARRAEVLFRQNIIDLMNKSLLLGLLPLETGRALSLAALHFVAPLKKFVMRRGLAPARDLPFAMRGSA